jgi:hypothetical protein
MEKCERYLKYVALPCVFSDVVASVLYGIAVFMSPEWK